MSNPLEKCFLVWSANGEFRRIPEICTTEETRSEDGATFVPEHLAKLAPMMLEALEQIVKAEGAYSTDPMTHAENCIADMQDAARVMISEARGDSSDE